MKRLFVLLVLVLAVGCGAPKPKGVFTLYVIPSGSTTALSTGLTVTSATPSNTLICDNTHTYTYSKGDVIQLKFANTQTSETLSPCMVDINYQEGR